MSLWGTILEDSVPGPFDLKLTLDDHSTLSEPSSERNEVRVFWVTCFWELS